MTETPATRHERLAAGRVLSPVPFSDRRHCIGCGMDALGCTLTTWKMFDDPGDAYPMCFWCLELWEARGWLRPVDMSTGSTRDHLGSLRKTPGR